MIERDLRILIGSGRQAGRRTQLCRRMAPGTSPPDLCVAANQFATGVIECRSGGVVGRH